MPVREVKRGEGWAPLIEELVALMWNSECEYAIVSLHRGARMVVRGGKSGIEFGWDFAWSLRRVILHTQFRVHALPHAATYSLMFTGYDPSDKTPSGKRFSPDQSIIARVVAAGDDNRIYFDGNYAPPTPPPGGFFLCER